MRFLRNIIAVLIVITGFLTRDAEALTTSWTNPAGGLWSVPGNWSQGVPQAGDSAVVTLNGTYTVTVDVSVVIGHFIIGAATGTQTLVVNQLFAVDNSPSVTSTVVLINMNGVVDLQNTMNVFDYNSGNAVINGGEIICNGGGGDLHVQSGVLLNDSAGVITLNGSSQIDIVVDGLDNYGTIDCFGTASVYANGIIYNLSSGLIDIRGTNNFNTILNNGLVNLRTGATLHLVARDESTASELDNDPGGIVRLRGNCLISGTEEIESVSQISNDSGGLFVVVADTSLADDDATISIRYSGLSFSDLDIMSGNLIFADTVVLGGFTTVNEACTLAIASNSAIFSGFSGTGALTGAGTLDFRRGVSDVSGDCDLFAGGFNLTGSALFPTEVTLQPAIPFPTLSSLRLGSNFTTFVAPIGGAVTTQQIIQLGGTIVGSVTLDSLYDWRAGTFTTVNAPVINIPVGDFLFVTGPAAKSLDSIDLVIDGTALFENTGVFSLVDSAVVNVRSAGFCDFGFGFTMNGVGHFYNSGDTDFDPQGDTIFMNVPVFNSTIDRTPGTIDILSRPVVFGAGGSNEGGLNVYDGGELILAEKYDNEGVFLVEDGGEIKVEDSLANSGTLDLDGGSGITGDGTLVNTGETNSQGSVLMSITNVVIVPELANDDSGRVNVLSDTLTLLNGGVNQGVITISAGSVLKVFGNFLNDVTGVIQGPGVLDVTMATFTNNGSFSPGASPGLLTIRGNVNLGATAQLNMELNGPALLQYDRILVNGQVNLGGTVNLIRSPSYSPSMTDTLRIMNYTGFTRVLSDVTGTAIGDGRFFEIATGPTGLVNYVCSGISDISPSVSAVVDTVHQSVSNVDTVVIDLCNVGHCPLQYSAELNIITPGVWITLASGDESGLVTRTNCQAARLYVDMTGEGEGLFQAELTIASNDPDEAIITIPLSWQVVHGPDFWDVGGGTNDFATIAAAFNYLNSSDIMHPQIFTVYPGQYDGGLSLNAISGASATNFIIFRAQNPANHPILRSVGGAAPILRLLGADHVTFDGIDVLRLNSSGLLRTAVLDTAGADFNVFRNMAITIRDSISTNAYGIQIARGTAGGPGGNTNDGIVIDNVHIYGCYTGIGFGRNVTAAASAVGNEVKNSLIENCIFSVYARAQVGLLVHDNIINPGFNGASVSVSAVYLAPTNSGDLFEIYNNQFSDAETNGAGTMLVSATFQSNSLVRFYNNMIYGWSGVAGDCRAIGLSSAGPTEIYNNSILMSDNGGPAVNAHHAIDIGSSSDSTKLFNNILASDGGADSTFMIYRSSGPLLCDRNCVYGPTGGSSKFVVGYDNVTTYQGLAAWQAGTGRDLNSIQDVPGFVGSDDLHIDGYYTTCDQRAQSVEWLDVDIDGDPRGGPFSDIGADEFTGITDKIDSLVIRRQAGMSNVQLNWEAIAGVQSWKIYRGVSFTDPLISMTLIGITSAGVRTFLDTTPLVPGLTPIKRFYKIVPSTIP